MRILTPHNYDVRGVLYEGGAVIYRQTLSVRKLRIAYFERINFPTYHLYKIKCMLPSKDISFIA
jgi:hypothetical protein